MHIHCTIAVNLFSFNLFYVAAMQTLGNLIRSDSSQICNQNFVLHNITL